MSILFYICNKGFLSSKSISRQLIQSIQSEDTLKMKAGKKTTNGTLIHKHRIIMATVILNKQR